VTAPRRLARFRASVLVAVALALAAATLVGCGRKEPPSRDLQPGVYRATVELPGGKKVPFELDVAREESGAVLYLVNGAERVRVPEVTVAEGEFTALMPGYENTLRASVSGGELQGVFTLVHDGGRTLQLPFSARLGVAWRFYEKPLSDNADLAGRWAVTYTGADSTRSRAVALLDQRGPEVTGTVRFVADDQRYLAGEVHDEELRLSRFDGGAVVLYEAKLDGRGDLVGHVWSDRGGRQRFTARRDPDANVDATALATQLRDVEARFTFEFPDLDGSTVSSADPRYAGKVLLVVLAGSWCPNSHDAAVVLERYARRYGPQGLEVVALMFEQHESFEDAAAAVRRFRTAHGLTYATLVAGPSDRSAASRALPQLDGVRAYPTVIFVDRSGSVRRIHTGFAGPATGVEHELLVDEFARTIEELLAGTRDAGASQAAVSP
jgi:thiol-disulfide isomerase/thioredoxin